MASNPPPVEDISLLASMLNRLGAAGTIMDTPAAMTRNMLAGQNPISPLADLPSAFYNVFAGNPMDTEDTRATGRQVLTNLFGMSENDPDKWEWQDFAGFGAEMLLDPLNLVGAGWVNDAAKAAKTARTSGNEVLDAVARVRGIQPMRGTIHGTHLSPNLESLSGGFVDRNPQLGVSIARNLGEEMTSPTLSEVAGSPGRVNVSVTGNGLDYTIPAHRQFIDEVLEQDSRNVIPKLRKFGIDWINGWNSIGADTELHVLNPNAIQITGVQHGPLRQFLDEAAQYRMNSPFEGEISASHILQVASDLEKRGQGPVAAILKALGLNLAGRTGMLNR